MRVHHFILGIDVFIGLYLNKAYVENGIMNRDFSSELSNKLSSDGFATIESSTCSEIEIIQNDLLSLVNKYAWKKIEKLEDANKGVPVERLNALRLEAINLINSHERFKAALLKEAAQILQPVLGPDIAVQKNFALVISMPGDQSSQIPFHADTWSGHSIFELNLWVPLSRSKNSASMFILPLPALKRFSESKVEIQSIQEAMVHFKKDYYWLDIQAGQFFLFWQHLPHGNVTNQEDFTRWSLNIRFKSLFAPYGEKGLGDYFVPLQYGALTNLALKNGQLWA